MRKTVSSKTFRTWEEVQQELDARDKKPWGFLYRHGLFGYNWMSYLMRPWLLIWLPCSETCRDVIAFWQRGRRGYADRDVCDLAGYLASWMSEALRRLASTTIGHPAELSSLRAWKAELDQVAAAFDYARNVGGMGDAYVCRQSGEREVFDEGMRLFHNRFFCLWD